MLLFFCPVKVKWGREKFDGVEVNTDEPPEVFKMQLFSLSGACTSSGHVSLFYFNNIMVLN